MVIFLPHGTDIKGTYMELLSSIAGEELKQDLSELLEKDEKQRKNPIS